MGIRLHGVMMTATFAAGFAVSVNVWWILGLPQSQEIYWRVSTVTHRTSFTLDDTAVPCRALWAQQWRQRLHASLIVLQVKHLSHHTALHADCGPVRSRT